MINLTQKRFFILGAARSGIAAARLVKQHDGKVFVSEIKTIPTDVKSILNQENIPFEENGHDIQNLANFDVLVVSPGISLDSQCVIAAKARGLLVISEIELALQFLNPKTRLIGITGTNGKSTTTHYLAHLLNASHIKAASCGNIGIPFSDVIREDNTYDALSIELSSYQLELGLRAGGSSSEMPKRFDVSILLNLQNDHLTRHKTFDNYLRAKWNLVLATLNNGICIVDKSCFQMALDFNFTLPLCKIEHPEFPINNEIQISNPCLMGAHNVTNIYAASLAARHLGVSQEKIISEWEKSTSQYKPLAHRLEAFRSGFINDSKATNVESTLVALKAVSGPLHLLLGGEPKGDSYLPISEFLGKNVVRVYPFGKAANKICEELREFSAFLEIPSHGMISASEKALTNSKVGDTILLSPACSSLDEFNNFEHRGDVFKAWSSKDRT